MFRNTPCIGQIRDTLYLEESSFNEKVFYSAEDSIFNDVPNKTIHLFGKARVKTADTDMKAGYLMIDLNKQEVLAKYVFDKDSNRIDLPTFTDGTEEIKAASIRYNFETKKGYIEELTLQPNEAYLYMGVAKKQANDEIHFKMGRFTTCNLPDPHYHFQLSRAVFIPDKRIVTGPMNLWVQGVPTPLGLPYAVIPQQKDRTHGILFPEFTPLSAYGFGFQNLGYYIPINDRMQTVMYANLYSRGSWGLRNVFDYEKRYGFSGTLDLGFQQFRSGFPDNFSTDKLSVQWSHRKEPKSSPYWNFSSNVNFISDNQAKNNLDPLNEQYFNNSFNSDINMTRLFPGKPVNAGMKVSVRQNSLTNNVSLTAPVFNFNVTRIFPFKKLVRGSGGIAQFFSRMGLAYNLEAQNRSNFSDSLMAAGDLRAISNEFMNGVFQNINIQTTTSFFKNAIKLTPNLLYTNKLNFQQINKTLDPSQNTTVIDTLKKSGLWHEMNVGIQATTVIYSYYKFVGKKKPLLRHLLTPSVGYRYVPQLNVLSTIPSTSGQGNLPYSPFERSVYTGTASKTASLITFGVNNTFELKRRSDKDTITGFKKTRIVDMLSVNGTYDLVKDSMKLSDISLNLRVSPIPWLNFVATSTFSPYTWDPATGKTLSQYALTSNGTPGRFLQTTLTGSATLTSKESRMKLTNTQMSISENWTADYTYFALHPEYLLDFNIPWKLTLSHVFGVTANTNKTALNPDNFNQVQTVVLNGDLSFTQRWKLAANINVDLETEKISNARFTLSRDMHCWALSFYWTPIGGNKSFLLSIRNTSSIFQDAKIELRKPPVFL
jgi:hypothetical protein